ncbi:MAG: hypothetical protein ACK4M2_00220 [Brevundimonas sp.]
MSVTDQKTRRRVKRRAGLAAHALARIRAAARRDGVGPVIWAGGTLALAGVGLVALLQASPPALPSHRVDEATLNRLAVDLDRGAARTPADATPALQIAYLESLRPGPLSAVGAEALRRSYALEPLGPDATSWRLRFVFDHWPAMPADLRRLALAELKAAFPRHGWAMRELPQSVADPSGRMVAVLMFDRLRAAQAVPAAAQNAR